jgi:hypothetical protein
LKENATKINITKKKVGQNLGYDNSVQEHSQEGKEALSP